MLYGLTSLLAVVSVLLTPVVWADSAENPKTRAPQTWRLVNALTEEERTLFDLRTETPRDAE